MASTPFSFLGLQSIDKQDVVLAAEGSLMTDRRLLAHERWLAGLVARRHAQRRTASVLRTEARFGPLGISLLAAALADVLIGQLLVLLGLVLLALGHAETALCLSAIGLGLAVVTVSSMRFRQGLVVGRTFRAAD
jgi:hypothetical protein